MLEIIAASSLSHSIEQGLTPEQKNIVKQIVYAEGGFNLNPRTNFKFKNVTDYIRATSKSIILWHDLINNSITDFKKIKPLTTQQLLDTLRSFNNLFAIVYCQRTGAENIFDELRTLDTIVIDVTKHLISKSESLDENITGLYRELHQSSDIELRSLSVVLHYYPNLHAILKTRSTKSKPSKNRRRAKKRQRSATPQ